MGRGEWEEGNGKREMGRGEWVEGSGRKGVLRELVVAEQCEHINRGMLKRRVARSEGANCSDSENNKCDVRISHQGHHFRGQR